jgi:hypothetical protein
MKQVVTFGVLLIWAAAAAADSPKPRSSYRQETADGRFVFVMLSPFSDEQDAEPWIESVAAEIREIRRTYKVSGLYRNDGSTEPIWTVDWYAHTVDVAADGVHLVRHGPWASSWMDEALTFFANGKELRSYRVKDLVDFPILMPHSVSHFEWEAFARQDDPKLEYEIRTLHGERYVFDMATGEMISSFRLPRWIVGIIVLVVAVFLERRWMRLWRERRAKRGPQPITP